MNFGKNCFQTSLLPSVDKKSDSKHHYSGFAPCLMQVTWRPFCPSFLTPPEEQELDRTHLGLAYTKDAV